MHECGAFQVISMNQELHGESRVSHAFRENYLQNYLQTIDADWLTSHNDTAVFEGL